MKDPETSPFSIADLEAASPEVASSKSRRR